MRSSRGALFALAALPAPAAPAAGVTEVDVKLVIATDVIEQHQRHRSQASGARERRKFLDPEVLKAIKSASSPHRRRDGRWSSKQHVVLDWTIVDGKESAADLPKKSATFAHAGERTSISGGLERSFRLLNEATMSIVAEKKVRRSLRRRSHNDGVRSSISTTRPKERIIVQRIADHGRDKRGLLRRPRPIIRRCVVAGKGAFLVVVKSYADSAGPCGASWCSRSRRTKPDQQALAAANPLLKPVAAGGRACSDVAGENLSRRLR